jgi:hypothetical protein
MLSAQLKEAIREAGISISKLARETEISRPNLHRFLSDDPDQHRDIRLEATADRIADYLGLSLQLPNAAGRPPQHAGGRKRTSTRRK